MNDNICLMCGVVDEEPDTKIKQGIVCLKCVGTFVHRPTKHDVVTIDSTTATLLKQTLFVDEHMNCECCGVYTNVYFTAPLCEEHREWGISLTKSLERDFGHLPTTKVEQMSWDKFKSTIEKRVESTTN